MEAGNGTDRMGCLHGTHGNVWVGEKAVLMVSNPSSSVSPDLAYNPGPARDAISISMHVHICDQTDSNDTKVHVLITAKFPLT